MGQKFNCKHDQHSCTLDATIIIIYVMFNHSLPISYI